MALPPRGVEDAGVFEQAHGGIVLIREPLGKGTEATRQEFGQVVGPSGYTDGVPRREDTSCW